MHERRGGPAELGGRERCGSTASAGDRAAQRLGEYGMTPDDLLACLPEALKERER